MSSNPADLLPRARIRLAALELFGQQGFDQTTIRQIAARAGVSPGLVIHHFGSKSGLRQACDDYAYQLFGEERVYLKDSGPMPTLERFMTDHPDLQPVMTYLVQCLRGGGEEAERVYQLFCSVSDEMLAVAERRGLVSLPEDRPAAIALIAAWSAGLQMLGDQFARRLGGRHLSDPAVMRRYAVISTELFGHGVLSAKYIDTLRSAIEPSEHKESDT